ncbi:acyl-CoA dehydrogenase family protein [Rhodococcus sp. ACPA1]|uniref:acyl-CoA dehydrogenase family protein n=1 Tax=Rhodococcus sp. ACPA1 TaxID=2028572 RepID=UPI000BB10C1D|nr:acyl-CoA dehydrogenase family protein [Rhodococcus sp. ACPA1]PBC51522.1 acyl-CoA dehydrogenase [Rhodococcus sp. ACPA1]
MAAVFNEEQSELRSMVRAYCTDYFSETDVRRDVESDSGFRKTAWERMATELGLQGIALPEEYGGAGAGHAELCIVIEELGRALAPAPFLSTVAMSANLLLATDDQAARERLLPGIADGSRIATVAHREPAPRARTADIDSRATRVDGVWRLSGVKTHVLAADQSSTLLVTALTSEGLSLFEVDAPAPAVETTPLQTLDLTRRQATVEFHSAPAILIGRQGGAAEYLGNMDRRLSAAVCAENVGGSLRLLEETANYARTRQQFGRPIGSFQAIKQKAADMLLNVELARSAAYQVARAIDSGDDAAGVEVAMAHALTSDAYVATAYDAIQIHGGIGFTWEHMAHLYFRRAKANAALFGTPDDHRERAAQLMGI